MPVNSLSSTTTAMQDVPTLIMSSNERADRSLPVEEQQAFHIRYLRRKPGRGLAIMYDVEIASHEGKHHRRDVPQRLISLTVDEATLAEEQYPLAFASSVLDGPGITVQVFPVDDRLPMLAECWNTASHSLLFQTLEHVARQHLSTSDWCLTAIDAQSIRYKPGSRCVLRYHLHLERRQGTITEQRELTLYGKLYVSSEQAKNVQSAMQALYDEQLLTNQQPILPCSYMGGIAGLVVSEAVQPHANNQQDTQAQTGTHLFRPHIERDYRGDVCEIIVPEETLRLTARALARLHCSGIPSSKMKVRTGAQEAQRARERANLLASYYPKQADSIQQLVQQLTVALESAQQIVPCLAHGGFKSSQLLFHSQQVFIIDFDGLCLADPALDIGYFLAYLCPTGLWYHRTGTRAWFEAAASVFVQAYRQAMLERGANEGLLTASIARSPMYEAALLFKIATRRVNRLNSPRPQELLAILDEIAQCLSLQERTS